ncbi:capsular polysaccharide transport system ATP-binding protein [Ruminobacter amylophilus]|uniref:Capsular polysaccharide transport system ATP-binding protein n=1 Tax=Ruminobacter amylophilus TaxID=867 RepID=A0A662ZI68_9GAMM|nr:ABC transporter ATP-binding protein [Ruminobacter amylophilus]SFP38254.1 capsular polysaccharide transport system ATP-binding protein [Ruminobacter amylophilus]
MIIVKDIYKRYTTTKGVSDWVLKGINLVIPKNRSVGIVGGNGAGKSTLLRIMCGADYPTYGTVERLCRVSWPMGNGGVEATMTGRQNAKFICRAHGFEDEMEERIARIQEFADLGASFDKPVNTYSAGMRSRLQFALSLAFDFDVYVSDEVTAAGDAAFKNKAQKAFENLVGRSSIIMVAHSDNTLKSFCDSGIFLYKGHATWYDKLDDALYAYKETIKV